MNDQTLRVAKVDVGTPPRGFQKWEMAEVCFHGFADLSTTVGEEIESPKFTCLGHPWSLGIFPGGTETSDDGYIAAFLNNKSADESSKIEYMFTVRNSVGEQVACFESHRGMEFTPYGSETGDSWGDDDFAKRLAILEALVEGTLTLKVWMRKFGSENSSTTFIPGNPLCQNILKKFMDEESADVVFEVGSGIKQGGDTGKKAKTSVGSGIKQGGNSRKRTKTSPAIFNAHRLILEDNAPMLAELCKQVGGKSSTVPIIDVEPDIFRYMLYYAYGGKIADEDLKEHAQDLIDATDKFGMVSLKLEAEASYVGSTTLTNDNIVDNLLYADSKNCALLKEAVMDHILKNRNDIMGKVSFDNVPSSVITDLLAAVTRGAYENGLDDATVDYNSMRVGTLRRKLHDRGLEIDGSREAMIALLRKKFG